MARNSRGPWPQRPFSTMKPRGSHGSSPGHRTSRSQLNKWPCFKPSTRSSSMKYAPCMRWKRARRPPEPLRAASAHAASASQFSKAPREASELRQECEPFSSIGPSGIRVSHTSALRFRTEYCSYGRNSTLKSGGLRPSSSERSDAAEVDHSQTAVRKRCSRLRGGVLLTGTAGQRITRMIFHGSFAPTTGTSRTGTTPSGNSDKPSAHRLAQSRTPFSAASPPELGPGTPANPHNIPCGYNESYAGH